MATDTQPKTLAELRNRFLLRVRHNAGVTETDDLADSFLNTALQDLHTGKGSDFPWAIRSGTIITHAPYTTGTVSITAAARTTVTGSGTAWNTAVTGMGFNNTRAGGKMKFAGHNEIYEVSSVGSDTSITLATRYTGAAISGSSYSYFEDTYSLASDFYRPADVRLFSGPASLPLVGRTEFNRMAPRNDTTGKPSVAAWIQLAFSGSTSPQHRVIFHPVPNDEYSIPYDYYTSNLAVSSAGTEQEQMTADTDEPIIPVRGRHALIEYALELWYADREDDLARAARAQRKYIDLLARLSGDLAVGQDRPRFMPVTRNGTLRRGRFDVGGRFDDLRW